jgi:hypothetical protein
VYTSQNVWFDKSIFGLAARYDPDLVSELDVLLPPMPTQKMPSQLNVGIAAKNVTKAPLVSTSGPFTSVQA